MASEDEITDANNEGQADRARYEDALAGDVTGLETAIRQIVTDDFYNPPDDSELREAYDAGFHNR